MTKPFSDCSLRGEYGPYANAAYGRDGTLYVAFIASDYFPDRERDAIPRHFFVARSTDDGRTFVTTRAYEAPDGNRDLGLNKGPMLAVDPSDSNKVYVGWRQGVRGAQAKENLKTAVAASSDGGRTFAPPVNIADERGGDYPALAVDGDGTVHAVVWTRTGTFPLLPADAPVRPSRSSTSAPPTRQILQQARRRRPREPDHLPPAGPGRRSGVEHAGAQTDVNDVTAVPHQSAGKSRLAEELRR